MLSAAQQMQFQQDGYLILPDFKTPQQIDALRARALEIITAFEPPPKQTVFTTFEQEKATDDYFLGSADQVRCFFEEKAFDEHGQLKQDKILSINKIGHAMHDLDPVFIDFSHDPKLAAVAEDIGLLEPQIWQSMYIFKQPGIGGEVRWHQDASFFETTPISVTTFWFALEDASIENGCLWAEPGGHRGARGVLRERFTRAGQHVTLETLDSTPWPDDSTAVALPVKAGSLILFHGLLPHYSAPNLSSVSRHAFTLHVTDGRTHYSEKNWIQRGAGFPVRGFR